jgi:hypothetical protein
MRLKKLVNKIVTKSSDSIRSSFKRDLKYNSIAQTASNKKNIVFLLPALRYPCGGNIVSHNNSETINGLDYKSFQSEILYPEEPDFVPTLFKHTGNLKKNLDFDTKKDFVIIPEIYAARHARLLNEIGVSYAINVQNGYLIDFELSNFGASLSELNYSYEHASIVIGISDDAIANIKMTFPSCKDKIIKSHYVIDKARLKPIEAKQNTITYMPRKSLRHTQLFTLMLNDKLPKNWHLQPIDGVSEAEVYAMFSDSKIFLSFSEFEGLAMPPAMAALSGNFVIGYTGEGNKEYFHLDCFDEVYNGDIRTFIDKTLNAVARFDKGEYKQNMNSINSLADMFSSNSQVRYLKQLMDEIDAKLN